MTSREEHSGGSSPHAAESADDVTLNVRSSRDLGAAIGWKFAPTDEQAVVIEFDKNEPALVVAGAGSGKTETMARRVVWLVANGKAQPSEVLGLTFTRKATAGLAQRINAGLAGLDAVRFTATPPRDALFDAPTISTYNAFANKLFQENALRVGYEPDSLLLTEAGSWQLAYDIVTGSADPRLSELEKSAASITRLVLDLSHAISDHIVDAAELATFATDFLHVHDLPGKAYTKTIREAIDTVASLPILLPLATEFARQKRERALIEYSDQVQLALTAMTSAPDVVAEYRSRYRYILLDEYQDTSVSQTRLLAQLFHDLPVMAVGDPNQSIYGWRGAAAGNLARFGDDFVTDFPRSGGARGNTFTLSKTFRNDKSILALANTVAKPLSVHAVRNTPVITLQPGPFAEQGTVEYLEYVTLEDEAENVAALVAEELEAVARAHGSPPEIAILFRTRKNMTLFADALRRRGVSHEVVGFGGVLDSPEVVDLRSALSVISSADAGNQLLRLLTGSRWRIGPKDVAALHAHARAMARWEDTAKHAEVEAPAPSMSSVSVDDTVTIVDALDHLGTLKPNAKVFDAFSPQGAARLRDAAAFFSRLRRAAGRPLRDLVRLVENELMLDIEVIANPRNDRPRRNLDIVHDKVAEYEATVGNASLAGMVGWFDRVAADENVGADQVEPRPGTVQLLTGHSAKGLEWDVVIIPRFVADEYPVKRQGGLGWLHPGTLPNEFRGDHADLPELAWRDLLGGGDKGDFRSRYETYLDAERAHILAEERRLLYVAVTRARRRLVITAGFVSRTRKSLFARSPYLSEVGANFTEPWHEIDSEILDAATQQRETISEPWPRDPLGHHRAQREMAAALVRVSADSEAETRLADAGDYADDLRLLIAENQARASSVNRGSVPHTIAASHLADYVADPTTMLLNAVRPIPREPSTAAALGTAFHHWVEQRYSMAGYSDNIDAGDIDAESLERDGESPLIATALDRTQFEALTDTFLRCEWANRRPVDVEVAITTTVGGAHVACKLDAVFRGDDGGYEVVDWKTGRPPQGEADLASKEIQLALYRHAYAVWKDVDIARVSAAFYYVAHDTVIRPDDLPTGERLASLIAGLRSISDEE